MSEEQSEPTEGVRVDGIWRPEEWKNGRYLISRYIENENGTARRQVHSESEFSAFALIYETLERAEAEAKRLNEDQIAKIINESSSPETQEGENEQ